MAENRESFERILKESDKRQADIQRHCDIFKNYLSQDTDFSSKIDDCQIRLNGDLEIVENYIIELSASCLRRLNDFNNSIQGMDVEINEVSGWLKRMKWSASSKVTNPLLKSGNSIPIEQLDGEEKEQSQINVPSHSFEINLNALKNVGTEIEAENSDSLIKIVQPDSDLPKYWTSDQDYFVQKATLTD